MEIALRPSRRSDTAAIVAVVAEGFAAAGLDPVSTLGGPPHSAHIESRAAMGAYVVAVDGDDVRGYTTRSVWRESSGVTVHLVNGDVAAGAQRRGIGTLLMDAAEADAEAAAPPDSVLGVGVSASDQARLSFFEQRGYTTVFSMVEMARIGPAPARVAISPLAIRPASVADARSIWALNEDVYADRPFTTPRSDFSHDAFVNQNGGDPGLWFVALDGDEVVGFVLCAARQAHAEITEVTVRPSHRRRGLARSLLHHALTEVSRRGLDSQRLHTNGEDASGALSLYRSCGFAVVERRLRLRRPMRGATRLY